MSGRDTRSLHCLVTGATGYIGGRLVPELLDAGYRVRCMARSPDKLRDHPWARHAEAVRGDVTDPDSVGCALRGIDVAYYLVHALRAGDDFEETDRKAAQVFAERARAAGVRRIVYLGGLTPADVPESELSPHLRSRAEVGEIFLRSAVPATVLRAAVIIGSGSASFEMLRYLTERLPVMVTPSWVSTRIQPIGVRDVLRYLVGSARMPDEVNRAFDLGGPDIMTYEQMMQRYAVVARLPHRFILRVPMLTPRLSGLWIGLITPVPPLPRPAAGRVAAARGHLPRARDRPVLSRSAGCTDRLRPGAHPGPSARTRCSGRHPLVLRLAARRSERSTALGPGLGRRQSLRRPTRARCRRLTERTVAGHRGDRR